MEQAFSGGNRRMAPLENNRQRIQMPGEDRFFDKSQVIGFDHPSQHVRHRAINPAMKVHGNPHLGSQCRQYGLLPRSRHLAYST